MSRRRYLVLHDYGMGGLWWWIHARSVRVDLDEVDVDAPTMPAGLDGLRAQRDEQRARTGPFAR